MPLIGSIKKRADTQGRLRVWVRDEDRHLFDERVEHALTGRYPSMAASPSSGLAMVLGRNVIVRSLVSILRACGSESRGVRPESAEALKCERLPGHVAVLCRAASRNLARASLMVE